MSSRRPAEDHDSLPARPRAALPDEASGMRDSTWVTDHRSAGTLKTLGGGYDVFPPSAPASAGSDRASFPWPTRRWPMIEGGKAAPHAGRGPLPVEYEEDE